MTAEVGVLNKIGVALAADSAITFGPSHKVYTSADKLFQLSESAPVGVMVYGNASFLDVPWETIVKMYRRELGSRTFPAVSGYADHFLNWLDSNRDLFPESLQTRFVRLQSLTFFAYLRESFLERLGMELQKGKITEAGIRRLIDEIVTGELEQTRDMDSVDGVPADFSSTIRKLYSDEINAAKKEVFEELPIAQGTSTKLTSIIVEILSRRRFGPFKAGVVVGGFGETEHFPSLVTLAVHGMAANRVLYVKTGSPKVDEDGHAFIVPFAQQEMVATFMDGIDPTIRHIMESSVETTILGLVDLLIEEVNSRTGQLDEASTTKVRSHARSAIRMLLDRWDDKIESEYSSPVMTSIAALTKEELAAVAEYLVNITKFKRRVSQERETVGGPIDVAVITKGDGFVWTKRKHYFPAELNPRFTARHYQKERRRDVNST